MAHLFGTDAWIKAYMQVINESPAYERAATTWEGDFYFVISPEALYEQEAIYYIDLWHGKCRSAHLVGDATEYSPEFRMETSDLNWKAVVEKRLDPIQGMMTRKIKLQGNMAKIMRAVAAAKELVNCASEVPTEFPDPKD